MIKRHLEFMKLLQVENDYKPASFYSKKLSVSTKTVYQDIAELKRVGLGSGFEIESIPALGIKLIIQDDRIEAILAELQSNVQNEMSIETRRIDIVKRVFFAKKIMTVESLSTEYFVSKTSIYNDLRYLNALIVEDNVVLESSAQGIEISGNEFEVQNAIKKIVYHFENLLENQSFEKTLSVFLENEVLEVVQGLIREDYAELTEKISDYYRNSLIVVIVIQCLRLRKNKHVELEEAYLFTSIRYMESYVVAMTMAENLSLNLNVIFNESDLEYLSRQLFAHRLTNNYSKNNEEYLPIIESLIERVSTIIKVDLSENERLYQSLIYHVPAMVLRSSKGMHVKNPLLNTIKEQYSELFSMLWYSMSILENEFDIKLSEDEISFMLIHFQIAIESQSKVNNIVIICKYGVSNAHFIFNKVRRFLPAQDNVEISTIDKFLSSKDHKIDLIISSIDIKNTEVPVVKVSPLVTNNDHINIMRAYTEYILEDDHSVGRSVFDENLNLVVLPKYVEKRFISLKLNLTSQDDCLDYMISELENRGYVSDRFRESVYQREKVGSTSLGSNVAIPHAEPITVLKSCVSIITLAKPVLWEN